MIRDAPKPAVRRPSAWGWAVTVSACLILGSVALMGAWWYLSAEQRIASYAVRGPVNAVTLDLGDADADIVGAEDGDPVLVERTERFAFDHEPLVDRASSGGALRLRVRCPATVLGWCSSRYRIEVPPNVNVTVRTSSGDVDLRGYRGSAQLDTGSGDIGVEGFCGFSLRARASSGDVAAQAACSPTSIDLRSRTGQVRVTVPPGRYKVDAVSDTGSRTVDGVIVADDAPFAIQALSSSGDVSVEAGS